MLHCSSLHVPAESACGVDVFKPCWNYGAPQSACYAACERTMCHGEQQQCGQAHGVSRHCVARREVWKPRGMWDT